MTPEESIAWKPTLPGGSTDILPFQVEHFATPSPVLPLGGVYLEVGSFFGRSICHMGLLRPDVRLVVCDPWTDEWEDAGETLPIGPDRERRDKYGGMYEAFVAGLREHAPELLDGMRLLDLRGVAVVDGLYRIDMQRLTRLTILRGPSQHALPAALPAASVDVAFLDGDHTLEGLAADITQARRVVRPGGLIAGHDYHASYWGSPTTLAVERELLLSPGAKGYKLAPWPYEREGWDAGHSSVWYADSWVPQVSVEAFALDAPEDPAREPVEP